MTAEHEGDLCHDAQDIVEVELVEVLVLELQDQIAVMAPGDPGVTWGIRWPSIWNAKGARRCPTSATSSSLKLFAGIGGAPCSLERVVPPSAADSVVTILFETCRASLAQNGA